MRDRAAHKAATPGQPVSPLPEYFYFLNESNTLIMPIEMNVNLPSITFTKTATMWLGIFFAVYALPGEQDLHKPGTSG